MRSVCWGRLLIQGRRCLWPIFSALAACWRIRCASGTVQVEDDKNQGRCKSGSRPAKRPAQPTRLADGHGASRCRLIDGSKRSGDNGAALRANRQMAEHLFAIVRRQRVLHERANQVSVWMVSELERFVHCGSGVGGRAKAP
jgi:hypothetical protein